MERHDVDQVSQTQPLGAPGEGGDDEVGRREQAVVRVVMLGKPGLVETKTIGELDLLQQLVEGLSLGHGRPSLVVAKGPKPHHCLQIIVGATSTARYSIRCSSRVV